MSERMSQDWWIIGLQGAAAIVFGSLALVWPEMTLFALVLLFAGYAFVDGALDLVSGFRRGESGKRDPWRIVRGLVGIAAGVVAFLMPGITAFALLILIAAWAIVSGVIELIAAVRLRHEIQREWLLALDGVVSILFGVLIVVNPSAGALAVVWLIGAFSIVSGVILITTAFRLRGRAGGTGTSEPVPAPLT